MGGGTVGWSCLQFPVLPRPVRYPRIFLAETLACLHVSAQSDGTTRGLSRQHLTQTTGALVQPLVDHEQIRPYGEMSDSQLEVLIGLARFTNLGARLDAIREGHREYVIANLFDLFGD